MCSQKNKKKQKKTKKTKKHQNRLATARDFFSCAQNFFLKIGKKGEIEVN